MLFKTIASSFYKKYLYNYSRDFSAHYFRGKKLMSTFSLGKLNEVPSDQPDINHIIENLPFFKDSLSNIKDIKKLDGWSNHNYLVSLSKNNIIKKYVLRVPGKDSEKHINRNHEEHNTNVVSSNLGICPKNLYFEAKSGILVRDFLEGNPPLDEEENISNENIKKMAVTLNRLHNLKSPFANNINNLLIIKHYENIIYNLNGQLSNRYKDLLQELKQLQEILSHYTLPLSPSHNDPNPRNFLETKDKFMLLDWEYSGNTDPCWDIAYLSTHSEFDENQNILLLNEYFGTSVDLFSFYRFNAYKPATEFILSIWIRMQILGNHYPVPLEELEEWEVLGLDKTEEHISNPLYQESIKFLKENIYKQKSSIREKISINEMEKLYTPERGSN
ncbi:MAG: phosphotransferase family protein [Sphingobacteriia bacterium]|nr:phosphotransferase family protein [Sphingobacteriia bacterium]